MNSQPLAEEIRSYQVKLDEGDIVVEAHLPTQKEGEAAEDGAAAAAIDFSGKVERVIALMSKNESGRMQLVEKAEEKDEVGLTKGLEILEREYGVADVSSFKDISLAQKNGIVQMKEVMATKDEILKEGQSIIDTIYGAKEGNYLKATFIYVDKGGNVQFKVIDAFKEKVLTAIGDYVRAITVDSTIIPATEVESIFSAEDTEALTNAEIDAMVQEILKLTLRSLGATEERVINEAEWNEFIEENYVTVQHKAHHDRGMPKVTLDMNGKTAFGILLTDIKLSEIVNNEILYVDFEVADKTKKGDGHIPQLVGYKKSQVEKQFWIWKKAKEEEAAKA